MPNTIAPLRLQFDEFELDEGEARLRRAGEAIELPPKAFSVLCALARQPGQLMTKDALLDAVWGHQHVSESVLKTIVSELRAALSDDPKQPRYIETASRRGYRFIAVTRPLQRAAVPTVAPILAPTMIGRTAALAQLREAWSSASGGQRQIFWIAGEAGVGKTTLIDNFVAGLGPAVYAHGQCVEQHGAGEPYLPVLEALGALCRTDAALVPMLRAIAPTWLLQLPWLSSETEREALRRELAGVGQERMLRELGELLDQYTQQRPLLLVTEDLHWSDHATVHLINHIARRRGPARLMWLASFRLAEVIAEEHPLKALRHELRLHRLCNEIALDPFSEQELSEYVGHRFPQSTVPETFVRALHARTDGLPLFVINVIDDLAAQGALQAETITSLQVPESLAGVIEKQGARLDADERAMLEAASVCGVEFRPATVAAALERDPHWVVERCDELARRQHWLGGPAIERLADGALDPRYTFRHALYRHVFYQRLGALARSTLHGRVAVAMERDRAAGVPATSAELALHYELSHALPHALRYYAEAAENALRHIAPREALDLTARALELLPRCPAGPMRDGLELALNAMRAVASAQLIGVSSIEAKQSFERARQLLTAFPRHPLTGLVLNGLGLVLMVRAEYAESRALGEHLQALAQTHGDRVLSLCAGDVMGHVSTLSGKHDEAIRWLEQGIADCEALGDAALQAAFVVDPGTTIYGALAIPLLHVGRIHDARARVDAALARAQRLGQPMSQLVANWFGALLEIRLGNVERVATCAAAIKQVTDDAALAQGVGPSLWFQGWVDAMQGHPHEGFKKIRQAYEHNTALGMYSGAPEVLCYGVEALILANDLSQAQTQLDEARKLVQRTGERVYLTQMHLLQARIACAQGALRSTLEATQAALREARDQKSVWLELMALVALCELDDAEPNDLDALESVVGRMSEGFDTAAAKRAHDLLTIANRAVPTGV
jgi:DNA-binding winged helix-turn-helix (wHTH) protein/tetratricopeptide (TPR) repeat protein